jgi:hypothetical protein
MEEQSYGPCQDEGGKRMVVRERIRKKEGERRKSKNRKTRWKKL